MDTAAATASSSSASPAREVLELFLVREAKLLDERRFREWMELFAEDGAYWVPAAPNQESPFNHASLFYDDRTLMKTRIDRLEHPRIHIRPHRRVPPILSETRSSKRSTRPRARSW